MLNNRVYSQNAKGVLQQLSSLLALPHQYPIHYPKRFVQADKDEKAAALQALVEALIPHRNKDVRFVPNPICSMHAA